MCTLFGGQFRTGKELVAKAVHYSSSRSEKPFVTVNIASLSENLLESELFGHVKGAFTGAISDRIGRFEEANGETQIELDVLKKQTVKLFLLTKLEIYL